jgi:hypothetical protein
MYFYGFVLGEAQNGSDHDGELENGDYLVATWMVLSGNPLATQTLKVDNTSVLPIGVTNPDDLGRVTYWCRIPPQKAGVHTVSIVSTDNKGNSITSTNTIYVSPSGGSRQGPSFPYTIVTEADAGSNHNAVLESSDRLLMTFVVNVPIGLTINTPTVKIDGKAPVSPIFGLKTIDANNNWVYYCSFAPLSAGKHSFQISTADSKGKAASCSGTFIVVAGQIVDAQSVATGAAALLSAEQAETIAVEARRRLSAVYGERASVLDSVTVDVADLGGKTLGMAADKKIVIDDDAAGHGWFIDRTPWDDAEFERLASGVLSARKDGGAEGQADLLTTVMHEMSHLLGFEHTDDQRGLMAAALPLGQRRLPEDEAMQPAATQSPASVPARAAAGNSVMDYLYASLEEEGQRKWSLLGRVY